MDLSSVTDITELKVMLADEYTKREQAAAIHQQATNNITMLQQRIAELSQAATDGDKPAKHTK